VDSSSRELSPLTFFDISHVELSSLASATAVLVNYFLLHINKLK
jgi:hypothetical protein